MALSLKPFKSYRSLFCLGRSYCEKSKYEIEEEGPKPRMVYGKPYPEWRKPWIQRDGEFRTKLSVFVEKNPSPDILKFMSSIPNFSFKVFKEWYAEMKELQEIENQKYLPKRTATLGSNLGAVHFFTYRQCAVRLKGAQEWISGDIETLNLPDRYTDGYLVEAVDCTNFHHNGIRYEGVQNLSNLHCLKWLRLKNNKHVDVWCIDRLAGQNGHTLEYLDISGCNICLGTIFALARMPALKFLVITDPGDDLKIQAALSMLEQEKPGLLVHAV
ncbi:hypothetical protein B5X24_HaOG208210 [Helicoverpa armigera]|uniref:Mitochondrial ATP synthase regulatory component factor B n=1 Tax=Helicoverpa armigera TaxID=29058 RepID=A0A2W1BKM2_HELAM|nr:hypothetical protein B5X24_HaOG208210 [Helicoverpa armigera]